MRAVVLGGAGTLGRPVVAELTARGVDSVAASRRTGVDLATGAGLAKALEGADVVVHAAMNPLHPKRVDLAGTRRVVEIVRGGATATHVVYVSIVGCDANPYPYYRVKARCETELASSGLAVTVVRATQFHPLVAGLARAARPLGIGFAVRGITVQPCDPGWVAGRVADLVTGAAPAGFARATDLAGPEPVTLDEGVRLVAAHDGVRLRRLVTLPALGKVARAFASGVNLPGPGCAIGGSGFREWLEGQPPLSAR